MNGTDLIERPDPQGLTVRDRGYLSSQDVLARMVRILEIQKTVMKEGIHYGTIPGTPKPTLYKPGAEKLLVTFQIASIPIHVEDLTTSDESRYRVRVQGVSQASGLVLGEAVGECSSNEEKYRWRKPVCDEEWDETPDDLRRAVWKKYQGKPYKAKQVRTSPPDVANTILQMATKRGLVQMARVVLACSDTFDQDLEDMPEALRETLVEEDASLPVMQAPQRKTESAPPAPSEHGHAPDERHADAPPAANGDVITEKQSKRFYAIAKGAGWSDEALKAWLLRTIGSEDDRKIPRKSYDDLCAAVGAGPK